MLWQIGIFGNNPVISDPTNIKPAQIFELIMGIINIVLLIVGIVAVIYIIMAGIQYIMAAGNSSQQTEAKKTIQAAVLGIIIVSLSFGAIQLLLQTFKFDDTILNEESNRPLGDRLK